MRRLAVALAGAALVAFIGLRNPILHETPVAEGSDDLAVHVFLPYASPAIHYGHDGMVMVYVPAGDFLMGSTDDDRDARDDEKPQHMVYLDAYWIDKTEVTNTMFQRFVDATGYETDAERLGSGVVFGSNQCTWSGVFGAYWRSPEGPASDLAGRMSHPVVQVSWNDADAYCRWAGRRLPTEAEWEKAARGTDAGRYPWGEEPPAGNLVNFADVNLGCDWAHPTQDDGYERTAPVGTFPAGASPYGALDMAGNVWEWVADWWYSGYYTVSLRSNPTGPDTGDVRVVRGGSWDEVAGGLRSSDRGRRFPDVRSGSGGFRCVRP